MKHEQYDYVKHIIEADMPVLLEGEAGSGKTTMAMQIAEDLGLTFHSMSMTKQTTVNQLVGFISIDGNYIPSQLRKAFESGGMFLLDEIDAADPNVLLTLNTIENGFIAFPDQIVQKHKDFRLVATANPSNEHSIYTGRSKLDFSTKDRFFTVHIHHDKELESKLTSPDTFEVITHIRSVWEEHGVTQSVTMRDAIRYHKLCQLGIHEEPERIFFTSDDASHVFDTYMIPYITERKLKSKNYKEAETLEEMWKILEYNPVTVTKDVDSSIDDSLYSETTSKLGIPEFKLNDKTIIDEFTTLDQAERYIRLYEQKIDTVIPKGVWSDQHLTWGPLPVPELKGDTDVSTKTDT